MSAPETPPIDDDSGGRDLRPVVIVGAGLAGLTCARVLHDEGVPVLLLDADDGVGGRVRTDLIDGHRVDRGFQVLLTSYPEAVRQLDFAALDLRRFEPGALVHTGGGRLCTIADPLRAPGRLLATLRAPVGSLADKLRVARLRLRLAGADLDALLERPQRTTRDHLHALGFSDAIVERFFRPFHGGVLLDRELRTSSRMFEFTFACFARGAAAIPAQGMAAIPAQLAARLPAGSIRLQTHVTDVDPHGVTTAAGERIDGRAVVVATDGETAAGLCDDPAVPAPRFKGTTLLVFSAPRLARRPRMIVLSGDPHDGPIDHLCVPSAIAPDYAPAGRDVVYATVLDGQPPDRAPLAERAQKQLMRWFGDAARAWELLSTTRIERALPDLDALDDAPVVKPVRLASGLFVCGDHRDSPSIQGALRSGRRAAEAVLAARGTRSAPA
ncbi:MAG: FAD-dependent oxidoreductase [Planctomycetes bacterium]|nr:FAD-dependent oxidoreductase [Planctomycetota bacterium]